MVIKSFANFLCTFIIKRIGGQKPFIKPCYFGQYLQQAAENKIRGVLAPDLHLIDIGSPAKLAEANALLSR